MPPRYLAMRPGLAIAHYRVTSMLGLGGMGEVWRATDTKLGREVAVKILPDAFATDPARMARFEREAHILASLNHPNIAAVYGVEQRALVMELVEGPTLADRIGAGPLPSDEALAIAKQIADALEAAHERGIVHRDLKPANIKIRPDGTCKVLDFGLAKATTASAAGSADPTRMQTITEASTVLGTPSYMSPEQARGQPVDKRADIWAFGVVLFEMVTGKRPFDGDSTPDILAAVLTHEPDWNSTPPEVRPLLKACLERDPKKRLHDIGDLRLLLNGSASAPPPAPAKSPAWASIATVAVAVLGVGSLVVAAILWSGKGAGMHPLIRFTAELGPGAVENAGQGMDLALSEDGSRIAYLVRNGSTRQVATRRLDQAVATVLPGTEGATGMFLSPDGQWVGFFADRKMKKTPAQGGPVVTLCDATDARGAWWAPDGHIVASLTLGSGLVRLPDSGGPPQPLTNPELTDEATHRWPQVLPGGDLILFTGHRMTMNYDEANLEVFSRRSGKWKVVHRRGYFGRYVPTGHLLYVHRFALYAVPFDLKQLEVRGKPVPWLEGVPGNPGNAAGRLEARNGLLVFFEDRPAPSARQPAWLDANGRLAPVPVEAAWYQTPRISPDGGKLAFSVMRDRTRADIVVFDLSRGAGTRLTFEDINLAPVWTPDGKHIVYEAVSQDSVALRWTRADGAGETRTLRQTRHEVQPASFSPDGRMLVFAEVGRDSAYNLFTMPLDLSDPRNPRPGTPERLISSSPMDWQASISPDGKWVAYSTGGAGGRESLYVRPFPPAARAESAKWEIAAEGSNFPIWSRASRELFFTQGNQIMVVEYAAENGSFSAGKPRPWLKQPIQVAAGRSLRSFDLSPDGKRFIVFPLPDEPNAANPPRLTVLLNFFDELKRRVPAN